MNIILEIIKTALFINLFLWIHRTYLINCVLKYDTNFNDIKILKEVYHKPRNVPCRSGIIGLYEKFYAIGLFDREDKGIEFLFTVNKYHTLTLRRFLKRKINETN